MESTKTEAGAWLTAARQRLIGVEHPSHEAQVLLAHVLQRPKAALLAHPETELSPDQLVALETLLSRRISGEPLPYILRHWEFYNLDLIVTPDVLIPRPETELLVEAALRWLQAHPGCRRAADVGVGSGAISAALLTHVPDLIITATDLSRGALRVAKANLKNHGVDSRSLLVQSDLLSACRGPFALVCANLPYIPRETLGSLEVASHEPVLALDGGADGLRVIERLLLDAPRWLASGGLMLLEIEATQGDSAPGLARRIFPDAGIEVRFDLAGLPRLLSIHF